MAQGITWEIWKPVGGIPKQYHCAAAHFAFPQQNGDHHPGSRPGDPPTPGVRSPIIDMSVDTPLTTTRSVRKRLDLT
jgi:hypothetical protein